MQVKSNCNGYVCAIYRCSEPCGTEWLHLLRFQYARRSPALARRLPMPERFTQSARARKARPVASSAPDDILPSMNEKALLRAEVLARRDAIPLEERTRRSETICHALAQLVASSCVCDAYAADSGAPVIAVYAAMRSEVNVDPFVSAAYAQGWVVCFPCMVLDDGEQRACMEFYRVSPRRMAHAREAFLSHPLRRFSRDALESEGYESVNPRDLDIVAVPLVAFDDAGGRLGYGGGNYDRLLPRLRPDALAVGVAFEEQRVEAVPREPHDVLLPHVVRG